MRLFSLLICIFSIVGRINEANQSLQKNKNINIKIEERMPCIFFFSQITEILYLNFSFLFKMLDVMQFTPTYIPMPKVVYNLIQYEIIYLPALVVCSPV